MSGELAPVTGAEGCCCTEVEYGSGWLWLLCASGEIMMLDPV